MADQPDDNILSRWSRRKIAAKDASEVSVLPPEQSVSSEEDTEAVLARQAELESNRKAAEAVDLDKLNKDSDLSVFMKNGVPELLRRQAMAILWRSDPVFANVDGLVDYGENYADPKLIMKTFKSAWQAGRGYLKEDPVEKIVPEQVSDDGNSIVENKAQEEPDEMADTSENQLEATPPEHEGEVLENAVDLEPDTFEIDAQLVKEEPTPRVSLRRRLTLNDSDQG
jgi:hypothetical protein